MTQKATISFKQGDEQWHRFRRLAANDLWFFNAKILGHEPLVPMRPYTHLSMVRFAERKTGIPEIDSARVQLIEVPRGSGKSTLVTKGRNIQRFLKNRNYALGLANETARLAKAFLGNIKAEFEQNELLRRLFPELIHENYHSVIWSADQIVLPRDKHRQEPSVLACGVDATVTGVHMDEWVLDDIISREAAENARSGSYTEIEKVNRWLIQLESLLTTPKRDPITIIGTRWWMGDSYDFARQLWGYDEDPQEFDWIVKLPGGDSHIMRLQRQGDVAIYSRPAIENGRSIFPERYTLEELERKRIEDPVFFAANYMNDPTAEEARDFKDTWLRWFQWDNPRQVTYRDRDGERRYVLVSEMDTVMSIDPAISESAKADRSGIVVSGTVDGKHNVILEAIAERLGVLDLCSRIEDLQHRYRCRRIFIESVAYQKALAQLLRQKKLPIVEVRPGTQKTKEMRIRALEPYFRQGHVYINASHHDLIHEYQSFPRGRFDDLLDAMTYLTEEWSRIIGRTKQSDEAKRAADAKNMAKLREWSVGRQSSRPRPIMGSFDRS